MSSRGDGRNDMKYSYHKVIALITITGFLLLITTSVMAISSGDGNLLKLSEEETCHACHKTDRNARTDATSLKTHSAEWLGTCSNTNYTNRTDCIANGGIWTSKWGALGWGIPSGKYGEFVCTTCHTAHDTKNVYLIKEFMTAPNSPTDNFPGSNIDFRILSGNPGDPGLMGDDTGGHTTSARICEVCHSQNKYHNYNTANNTGGLDHNNAADCTSCHSHLGAFRVSCDACHGNPPTQDSLGWPNGLANNPSTGSQTAGAHNLHVNSKGFSCNLCHYNSVGTGTTHRNTNISLGFENLFGLYTGGSYDGQTTANYESTHAGTTVSNTGTKTCSSLYCHGSTMAPNGGTNITPVWNDASTAQCGTCHGATNSSPPLRGSHRTHAYNDTWSYAPNTEPPFNNYIYGRNMACTVCHSDYTTNHVNGKADWSFDTTTYPMLSGATYKERSNGSSSPVPGAYGQCTNLYCHSIVQTNTGGPLTGLPGEYKTPTWGNRTEGNCGTCHDVDAGHAYWAGLPDTAPEISTGSHTKHLQILGLSSGLGSTPGGPGRCAVCHNYAGSDSLLGCASACHNRGDMHVNYQIEVKFPPTTYGSTAAYNGSPQPGDGFGSCSNTYCHGNFAGSGLNATPTWNNAASGVCGTCHAGTSGRSYLGDGTNRSHYIHVDRLGYACDLCHYDTTTGSALKNSVYHVNGAADWHFNPNDPRTAAGTYSDTRTNPMTWSSQGSRTPPRSVDGTADADGNCANITCHSSVQGVNDPTEPPVYYNNYYNIAKWGSYLDCNGCHKAGNHRGSDRISTGSHAKHLATFGSSIISNYGTCQVCHYIEDGSGNPCSPCHDGFFVNRRRYVNHGNNLIEVTFLTSFVGSGATYSGDPAPRTPYGSCSNIYCHSIGKTTVASGNLPPDYNGSIHANPTWGSSLGCNGCHGRTTSNGMPDYTSDGAGTANANSHQAHVSLSGYGCQECHYGTTNDGSTISNHDAHINKVINDVSFNTAGSYNSTDKTCSSTYCHSDGTSISSGVIPINISPAWGGSVSCDSCHGFPPAYNQGQQKNDSHDKHVAQLGYTCNTCHLDTTATGNTITNRANHANRVYNVQADPSVIVDGNPVSFTYTFNPLMSRCDNISCHGGSGNTWASITPSAHIAYSFGSWCYEVNFTGNALGGTPPYAYEWDLGDGQTTTGAAITHRYASAGPYTVTLTVQDANLVSAVTQISVTPQNANQPAVAGYTVSVSGMTVTLTDRSYDPDYNQCGHSGPGIISILWGDNTNTTSTNFWMTDAPSNQVFTHTYANPGTYWINHAVKDNTCQINWCKWNCGDCTGTKITVPQ